MDKKARKNAYLYCKFRDEQYDLYDKYAKRHGISMKSFLILNALYYAGEGMTQKEISERTFNSKQTVNLIVRNLKEKGYVVMEAVPGNKKEKKIVMTDAGRNYCEDMVTHITWSEDKAMSLFSEEEQEILVNLSRKFTENLTKLVNGKEEHETVQ